MWGGTHRKFGNLPFDCGVIYFLATDGVVDLVPLLVRLPVLVSSFLESEAMPLQFDWIVHRTNTLWTNESSGSHPYPTNTTSAGTRHHQ